jgi:hypothetical protein
MRGHPERGLKSRHTRFVILLAWGLAILCAKFVDEAHKKLHRLLQHILDLLTREASYTQGNRDKQYQHEQHEQRT